MSYQSLVFDFRKRGLVSITGVNEDEPMFNSNGVGKTSLVQVLGWGLYGKASKGENADSIINKKFGKDCRVQIEWENSKVIRYRGHHQFKDDLQFYIDGVDQTGKSNKETQSIIEHHLGLNYSSFLHSLYFSQNNLNNFASANDAEQKEIIENILNLSQITFAQEWCKEQMKVIAQNASSKMNEIVAKKSAERQFDARISDLSLKVDSFESVRASEKKTAQDNIGIIEMKLVKEPIVDVLKAQELISLAVTCKPEYDSIFQQKNTIDQEIKQLNDLKLKKANDQNRLRMEVVNHNNKLKLDHQNKLNEEKIRNNQLKNKATNYRTEITRLEKELGHYLNAKEKVCITCSQAISDQQSQKNIDQLKIKMENLIVLEKEAYQEVSKSLFEGPDPTGPALEPVPSVDVTDEITPVIKEREKAKFQLDERAVSLKHILDTAGKLAIKIEQEKARLVEAESIDRLIAVWEQKIREIEQRDNPYTEQITQEQMSRNVVMLEINDLQKQKDKIDEEIKHYEYWVEGFSNRKIKSFIMESITPFINERANKYSRFMTGGSFIIDISTQTITKKGDVKEKFSVNVTSTQGSNYDDASGGEKRRIDLCILLALQDLVASRAKCGINILILDECTENLDSVGVERMIELLQDLATEKETVMFITHDDTLKNYFPTKVEIVKKNGLSSIIA